MFENKFIHSFIHSSILLKLLNGGAEDWTGAHSKTITSMIDSDMIGERLVIKQEEKVREIFGLMLAFLHSYE